MWFSNFSRSCFSIEGALFEDIWAKFFDASLSRIDRSIHQSEWFSFVLIFRHSKIEFIFIQAKLIFDYLPDPSKYFKDTVKSERKPVAVTSSKGVENDSILARARPYPRHSYYVSSSFCGPECCGETEKTIQSTPTSLRSTPFW